jgi:hypothetical protein
MKKINIIFKTLILVLGLGFVSCNETEVFDEQASSAPVITDFSPKSGKVGTEVRITGEYLQQIDTVRIGGGLAELKYRVNPQEIVVVITANNKTGSISVSGNNGQVESSGSFSMEYTVPALINIPSSAKTNADIYIEGDNLDAVLAVYFGSVKGEIISQSEKDMIVRVPFFEDEKVDLIVDYNSAEGLKQVSTSGKPFELERPIPVITNMPATGEIGTSITITGVDLTLIDEIYFGAVPGIIRQKTDDRLTVLIPDDFNEATTVELSAKYYGTRTLVINPAFRVKAIYYWENKEIFAQDESTSNNFFNALTGDIYTPCQYAEMKNNIHFFINISASSITLHNPAQSGAQTASFRCNGVPLPSETMPNTVRLRELNPANPAHLALIEKVKNRELESISPADIDAAGIPAANSGVRRFYGEGNTDNNINPGDVVMFQLFSGSVPQKVGFIEILRFNTTNPTSDRTSSMTFNCYFQK